MKITVAYGVVVSRTSLVMQELSRLVGSYGVKMRWTKIYVSSVTEKGPIV